MLKSQDTKNYYFSVPKRYFVGAAASQLRPQNIPLGNPRFPEASADVNSKRE